MAIASAVERSGTVYIYDESGRQTTCVPGGSQPGDGLQGYTSRTVSVRHGSSVYIYDEEGRQINTVPAR